MDSGLLFVHLLAFAYWVGADVAVFYGAGFSADPNLPASARAAIGRLTKWVDQFPRSAVPVIGATGASVAVQRGYLDGGAPLVALVWIAAIVWIWVNFRLFKLGAVTPAGRSWNRFDLAFRGVIMLALAGTALGSLLAVGEFSMPSWLAAKVLLFAASIAFAMAVRVLFKPFRPALARIEAGTAKPEDPQIMRQALLKTRLAVAGIWFCAGAAAFLGLSKPG